MKCLRVVVDFVGGGVEGRDVFRRKVIRLSIRPWQRLHLPYIFPTCATRRRRWTFQQEWSSRAQRSALAALAPPTLLPHLCHKKKKVDISAEVKQSGSAVGPVNACIPHTSFPPVPQEEEGWGFSRREADGLSIGQHFHLPYFFPTYVANTGDHTKHEPDFHKVNKFGLRTEASAVHR